MRGAIIAAIVAVVLGGLGLGNFDPPSSLVEGGIPAVEPMAQMQPEEIVAETPPEAAESPQEAWYEPEWYPEPDYSEPAVYEEYSEPEPWSGDAPDLRSAGVVDDGERTWTWYSSNTLPGNGLTDLNNNGRTVDDRGFVTDGDGYIAVASPWGQDPIGTVIETPYGPGKIYDSNEGGSYDLYTNW